MRQCLEVLLLTEADELFAVLLNVESLQTIEIEVIGQADGVSLTVVHAAVVEDRSVEVERDIIVPAPCH